MSRQFNGTNYLEGGLGDAIAGIGAMTIAAWVYRPAAGNTIVTLACGLNASNLFELTWFNSDNKIYFDVRNGSGDAVQTAAKTASGWNHIAGTWDGSLGSGSRGKIYLNGDDVTSSQTAMPTVMTSSISTQYLRLGNLQSPNINSSSGTRLGDTVVLTVAASRSQTRDMMYSPIKVAGLTSCLHYWRLDNDNTTQRDIAGNRTMNSGSTTHSTIQPPIMFGF